jgi:uncharacterized membrane protein
MISFMRGYSNIIGDSNSYSKLSKVMHGYPKKVMQEIQHNLEVIKIKRNKLFLSTTVICFLPLILSFMLYDKLPEQIAIHFSRVKGDDYVPKAVGAFGLPVLMAVINILTHFKVNNDPNKINPPSVSKYLGMWSAPVTSVILIPEILFLALEYKNSIQGITSAVLGIIITMFGNYLPKCKRNYAIGIKLPWTLNSEANWNKAHHVAGDIWILGGICMIIRGYITIQGIPLTLIILIVITMIPFLYSYWLYRKGV